MLRIRTGAHYGLRWGVLGFATVAAVLTVSSAPTYAAPYADIVVDANSGKVLHETNPDARRHPASLTKIMTLYLLFEQLEAGKLKLDSQLNVSAEAAGQDPTKLGLKPGSTLQVEDAIKGIVTRSANDAAVVVAEAIGGDEDGFARLMTRKALALGMSRTVYKNASGLPDDDQVTTARDQSVLGRAIQERFPKYYKYFSIRSFTFRGQSIGNHNHLLGRVDGVDGIKTGYISASGFNLVTSVHRGNRYLVAVVMGGSSAGSRDSRMRELISEKIAEASTKRTAPMVAEGDAPEGAGEPKALAKAEPQAKPEPKVAAKTEPKAEPRFAVASSTSGPARFTPSSSPAEPAGSRTDPSATTAFAQRIATGSTDPIRPVLVKTVTVKAAGPQAASPAPLQVSPPPAADPQAAAKAAAVAALKADLKPELKNEPKTALKIEPKIEPKIELKTEPKTEIKSEPQFGLASAASVPARLNSFAPTEPMRWEPEATAGPAPGAKPGILGTLPVRSAAMEPAPVAAATKAQIRTGWMIQVGAFQAEQEAKQRLTSVQSKASKVLNGADPFTETVDKGGTTFYRARFAGLDKDKAEAACKYLKRNDVDCVTIKN
jgi:D-alanyl-D-alanine carboxypeptidase